MAIWIVLGITISAVGIAIGAFFKTSPEKRWTRVVSLEQQLAASSPEAEAVMVKGDKRRSLIRWSPFIFAGISMAIFNLWLKHATHAACVSLLGINAVRLSLLLVCYLIPLVILLATIMELRTGLKTLKTGYFPPLDAIVFSDTIAKRGPQSKARGALILALPLLPLVMLYMGNNLYTDLAAGKGGQPFDRKLQAGCSAHG